MDEAIWCTQLVLLLLLLLLLIRVLCELEQVADLLAIGEYGLRANKVMLEERPDGRRALLLLLPTTTSRSVDTVNRKQQKIN